MSEDCSGHVLNEPREIGEPWVCEICGGEYAVLAVEVAA